MKLPMIRRLTSLLAFGLAAASALAAEPDILPVEQAFALDAKVVARDRVELGWRIADGYYLYRDKIKVVTDTPGVVVGSVETPPGERKVDEFLGDVEIYHGQANAVVPLAVDDGVERVSLAVTIQGCHEREPRICYPPYRTILDLVLPPAAASSPAAVLPGGPAASSPPASTALPGAPLAAPASVLGASTPAAGLTDALPLPAEEAFRFEAIVSEADGGLLARFTMAPGYYLYRDRSEFSAIATPEVTLAAPRWPAGVEQQDEHYGRSVVFFDTVEVPLPLARAAEPTVPRPITLRAEFQGCQLDGICYPPMTRELTLALPAPAAMLANAGGSSASMSALAAPVSEQDYFADALRGRHTLAVLGLFFVVGLGLAFTPCVLPMLPILSGILSGAGDRLTTHRALWLSLIYVLASAVVFAIVGVIAGVAGENLSATLQKPAVLIAFAGLFVVLALSMFGFYELQMPAWLQNRVNSISGQQKAGSTTGVAVMGLLSALLVGPCVAPPLAGAVLYISQQKDPVLGGFALFAMGLGMGAPLIALGAGAGRLLPRAGAWMEAVKKVFGVVFLALALWMLERVLDPVWIMFLAGLLLLACGVHLGALERLPDDARGWRRTAKAAGLALLVLGVIQFLGVASGGRNVLQPLSALANRGGGAAPEAGVPFQRVGSSAELDAAIARAAAAGKPVLFDFYADWCVECKRMEGTTFADAGVRAALEGFVLLKIDVTDQTDEQEALQQRFGIIGPPATLFFSCQDEENRPLRLIGYEGAGPFAQRVQRASSC
jgi:thiol:disulfide interchange protein DsbD